jgi:16S rRNA (cytidine1402-2'-O)-methyltransferase
MAGKRKDLLASIKEEQRTVILYEAPHRLLKILEEIGALMGEEQPIVVARELTKIYQEVRRGSVREVKSFYTDHPPRGEICLLIPARGGQVEPASMDKIMRETKELIDSGMDKKEAFKMKAHEYKVKKSTIYKQFLGI